MEIRDIMRILPHRYPFLLVDRIVSVEIGTKLTAIKNVTINEPFFIGHFPGRPIMPGVLTIEALAQAAGILAFKSSEIEYKSVFFMSIEKAKFRKPVVPGDQLRLEVTVLQKRGNVWKFTGTAFVEDKAVSEAEFTAMMTDKEI